MSIDLSGNQEPPLAHVEVPKTGNRWLKIGCGCLGVLGLMCAVGGGLAYYYLGVPLQKMQATIVESIELASVSPKVEAAVGGPVSVSPTPMQMIPKTSNEGGVPVQEMEYQVTGSEKSAVLVIKIGQPSPLEFERMGLELRMDDGTVIELDPDAEFDLEIDPGQ